MALRSPIADDAFARRCEGIFIRACIHTVTGIAES